MECSCVNARLLTKVSAIIDIGGGAGDETFNATAGARLLGEGNKLTELCATRRMLPALLSVRAARRAAAVQLRWTRR